MTLPTQNDAFYLTLELFADGKEYTRKEISHKAIKELSLDGEDTIQRTKSGTPIYQSRFNWGISYLERAGMLERVRRGVYVITSRGKVALDEEIKGKEFLSKLRSIIDDENPWNIGSGRKKIEASHSLNEIIQQEDRSPQEIIELAIASLNESLASELLNMILDMDPYQFEEVVVKLLEAMGYGTGEVTSKSGDGGIDGIITADPLGFDTIYTQAKRYSLDNKVGTPEVQAFIGALGGVTKGVFITTSSFQPAAVEIAEKCHYAKIELIDGEKLINLMMKYNVGVMVDESYEVKRIDLDFFDELL